MDTKKKLLVRFSFPIPTGNWGYLWGVELWGRNGALVFLAIIRCHIHNKNIYISSLKIKKKQKKSYQLHNKSKLLCFQHSIKDVSYPLSRVCFSLNYKAYDKWEVCVWKY